LQALKELLHSFSEASGLQINYYKSNMVPFNLTASQVSAIFMDFQCQQAELPITYLGLPLTVTRPDRVCFMPLIENLEKGLAGWKGLQLSRGGRHVLADSMLSAIPTYYMACFKLHTWVVKIIDQIRMTFLWKKNDGSKRGVSWINFETVCMPKKVGGLGLKKTRMQNTGLLMKWI
jgi:hypothetical protein